MTKNWREKQSLMQDPEKEGQTQKQIKNQNQKTPRSHSSKQAKPVYIPAGYESLQSSGVCEPKDGQ